MALSRLQKEEADKLAATEAALIEEGTDEEVTSEVTSDDLSGADSTVGSDDGGSGGSDSTNPANVTVTAVFNRMRNPHTGAVFLKTKHTDVIDLEAKENAWVRSQLKAGVLKIVK